MVAGVVTHFEITCTGFSSLNTSKRKKKGYGPLKNFRLAIQGHIGPHVYG